jgi:TPR repeat protein
MSMPSRRLRQLFAALIVMLTVLGAQAGEDFPGAKPDRRVLKTQQKVDSLFEKGDFERAYFIYREELVPLGDKYAQYMVGYMTLVGKGVSSDLIAGSAWYRLAAERGDSSFRQASDEVLRLLNDEQRRLSDQRYLELRREFSDAMIVASLIEKDLDVLQNRVEVNSLARDLVGAQYYNNEELAKRDAEAIARIGVRLSFLAKAMDSPEQLTAEEVRRIEQIEGRADIVLQSYKPPH